MDLGDFIVGDIIVGDFVVGDFVGDVVGDFVGGECRFIGVFFIFLSLIGLRLVGLFVGWV